MSNKNYSSNPKDREAPKGKPVKVQRTVEFLKGDGRPFHSKKIGRNEPCKCGSGVKSKNCCGTETKYFINPRRLKKEDQAKINNLISENNIIQDEN